jgi:plastocyanin
MAVFPAAAAAAAQGPPGLSIRIRAGAEDLAMNNEIVRQTGPMPDARRVSRWRRGVVALAMVGVAVGVAACSSGGSTAPSTAASGGGTDAITIHNFAFSPATLTVKPGATVTVANHDQVAHTVTATHGAFNTGDISDGQSKTFTAPKTPGKYTYICSIHQYMSGTLIVSG